MDKRSRVHRNIQSQFERQLKRFQDEVVKKQENLKKAQKYKKDISQVQQLRFDKYHERETAAYHNKKIVNLNNLNFIG